MKIFTSYYENIPNIPKDYILISISGGITEEIKKQIHYWDKRLAPSWSIYKEYSETNNSKLYTDRFYNEILSKIDLEEITKEWEYRFGCNKTFVLLCYEKPNEFCHRQIISKEIDLHIKEL